MAVLSAASKAKIVDEFKRRDGDTGSSEVQVALLTEEIKLLTEHCNQHKKDFQCRRGLLNLVSKRRRLLAYMKRTSYEVYVDLIKKLGLRH